MRAYLERLLRHIVWADARVLDLLHSSPAARACDEAMRLQAHVLAAEWVWLLRLRGESSASQPIWPSPDLAEMDRLSRSNTVDYARFLEERDDAALERKIEYRNSAGTLFRTVASDVLLHVALHGSYHRGQVARAFRAAGVEPVNTDYITFVRTEETS